MFSRMLILTSCIAVFNYVPVYAGSNSETLPDAPLAELKFFDGETVLDPSAAWSLRDGELVCLGTPMGYLVLRELEKDYLLSFEWKWENEAGGNSGVLINAIAGTSGFRTWATSVEVQLEKGQAGDLYAIGELVGFTGEGRMFVAPGVPVVRLDKKVDAEKAGIAWNVMTIKASGDEITVWVNGVEVNRIGNVKPSRGAIALQSEGAPIRFRNLRLESLEK